MVEILAECLRIKDILEDFCNTASLEKIVVLKKGIYIDIMKKIYLFARINLLNADYKQSS